jgi:hypothetical protein
LENELVVLRLKLLLPVFPQMGDLVEELDKIYSFPNLHCPQFTVLPHVELHKLREVGFIPGVEV